MHSVATRRYLEIGENGDGDTTFSYPQHDDSERWVKEEELMNDVYDILVRDKRSELIMTENCTQMWVSNTQDEKFLGALLNTVVAMCYMDKQILDEIENMHTRTLVME